jgi:hypothetical protein
MAGSPDGRPSGRSAGRRFPRHHRRGLADAAAVARLCRGAIAEPGRGAGDQPALSVRPHRPPRDDRWAPLRPQPLCGTRTRPLLRRRDPPGAAVERDDELLDYARQKGSTVHHATCTCKMGGDRMAVVDDQLRVHGLEGFRVAYVSVMPTVTSTQWADDHDAEKSAAMIKGGLRHRLAAYKSGRRRRSVSRYRQAPPTHPIVINNDNALRYLALAHDVENFLHPGGHIGLAPVTATKQDQAWAFGSGKRQQPWVIEVGGDHNSRFLPRAHQDFGIRGAIETRRRGVNGVVSLLREPTRQGRR